MNLEMFPIVLIALVALVVAVAFGSSFYKKKRRQRRRQERRNLKSEAALLRDQSPWYFEELTSEGDDLCLKITQVQHQRSDVLEVNPTHHHYNDYIAACRRSDQPYKLVYLGTRADDMALDRSSYLAPRPAD